MNLRPLHRANAMLLGLFLAAHLANHLAALGGVGQHIAVMAALRHVYRGPAVEALLLAGVAVQVLSGLAQVVRGWRGRRGFVAWLQAGSGAYLALFLLIHVSAVLSGRASGLDTNFHFAAAGMFVAPFQWFFIPYYSLAVAALFSHLGCAFYWGALDAGAPALARRRLAGMIAAGVVLAAVSVSLLAGRIVPVHIPAPYLAKFAR